MKQFSLWILLMAAVLLGFTFLLFSTFPNDSLPAGRLQNKAGDLGRKASSRKTEENNDDGDVDTEDYNPVDPSPATKASVKPGPIQHGTPLNPYVPTPPSPPDRNKGG